jgi:hypothetical protein
MLILFTALGLFLNTTISNTYANQSPNLLDQLRVVGAALKANDQFISNIEAGNFAEATEQGMSGAIQTLASEFNALGLSDLADELLNRYENDRSILFSNLKDLGDHAPLFPWLQDIIRQAEERTGTTIYNIPIVKDIVTLNFAIPVVFKPNGIWRDAQDDDRIEYRKHFIPFANIVTFYGVQLACNYFVQQQQMPDMKRICKPLAEKLQFVMGRYIAPPLSDWVFKTATQGRSQLVIAPQHYESAESLHSDWVNGRTR